MNPVLQSPVLHPRTYRLTTAEILFHMPDHPKLLQSYVWQDMDTCPSFPALRRFLDFWQRELDGKIHTVRVAYREAFGPAEWRHPAGLLHVH